MRQNDPLTDLGKVKETIKSLSELLCLRGGRFLFLAALKNDIPLPGSWTDEETESVRRAYYSESDSDQYYLQFLQDWEDGKYESSEDGQEPENEEERSVREVQKQWMEHKLSIARKLCEINERKTEIAVELGKVLLQPEQVRKLMVDMGDPVIFTLRDILAGKLRRDEEGFFPIECEPDQRTLWNRLEKYGYAVIRKTDPYDEEDDRKHYTGIALTDDTLQVMRDEDNAEMESERNQRYIMYSLEIIIQNYYELVPIPMAHKLYQILRQQNPERYPDMEQEEFLRAFESEMQEDPGSLYGSVVYRGKKYIRNLSGEELTDEMTGEDSYEAALIETWEEGTEEPYIPSLEELLNHFQYSYWEARKPYRELWQFVKGYYLDEQTIEESGCRFMRMGMDDEEWTEYARKRHYSMDMVEERTNEKFFDLFAVLTGGNDAGEIYKNDKDFTCALSDSARRKYRRLLAGCAQCTPRPWYLGKSDEQYNGETKKTDK